MRCDAVKFQFIEVVILFLILYLNTHYWSPRVELTTKNWKCNVRILWTKRQEKSTCESKCFFQLYSPYGEWYCPSGSDIMLRIVILPCGSLRRISYHCEQSEQYHFCGRQKYHAEHGSAYHHLFTTASVIAAKWGHLFTSAQVNRILPRAGLGILLTLLYIINLSIPQLFLYYPAMQHKKTTANFVGCCFLISTP